MATVTPDVLISSKPTVLQEDTDQTAIRQFTIKKAVKMVPHYITEKLSTVFTLTQ
jgi:hypothetical protein